jgi:hypothetical protein
MEEEYDYLGVDAEEEEMDGLRFFDPSLMSNVAVQLHDKVVRGEHIKGSLPFRDSFTGKDIVVRVYSTISFTSTKRKPFRTDPSVSVALTGCVQTAIQSFMPPRVRHNPNDRRAALEVAKSLKSQLFFIEVDFEDLPLTDSLDDGSSLFALSVYN